MFQKNCFETNSLDEWESIKGANIHLSLGDFLSKISEQESNTKSDYYDDFKKHYQGKDINSLNLLKYLLQKANFISDKEKYNITFDSQSKKIVVKDISGNSIKEFDSVGKEGKSAFTIWKEQHPEFNNPSEKDFLDFLKGKDGSNGSNGKDGRNGENGKDGKDGRDGIDGKDGKDGENGKDGRDGKDGKNGQDGKDGDNGKSAFEIWKELHPELQNPTVEVFYEYLKGDKGESGTPGAKGKSAYEIWRDSKPENKNKTEQEFLDSLKGADGLNMKKEYDWHDIEDYVCPTLIIPENMMRVKKSYAAEDVIKERAERLKKLRRRGREIAKNNGSWFKNIMWWCAGADRDLLYMCPADHSKYVGIGTVILSTAVMAVISSTFAIYMIITNGKEDVEYAFFKALGFGLLWGAMIFFLDRFITNTMYSDGKVTISPLEFRSALPRIIISIFIGVVISTPLELTIFRDKITYEIEQAKIKERDEYVNSEITKELADYQTKIDNLDVCYQQLVSDCESTNKSLEKTEDEPGVFNTTKYKKDDNGKFDYDNPIPDEKPNNARNSRIDKLTKELNNLKTRRDDTLAKLNALKENKTDFEKNTRKQLEDKFDNDVFDAGLVRRISILHRVAMKDSNGKDYQDIDRFNYESSEDILYHIIASIVLFLMCVKLYNNKDKLVNLCFVIPLCAIIPHFLPEIARFFYFVCTPVGLIMMLFIIIDVSPVFYKMMVADGKYDKLMHEEKKIEEDRIRLDLTKEIHDIENSDIGQKTAFVFGETYEKMQKKTNINEQNTDGTKHTVRKGTNTNEVNQPTESDHKTDGSNTQTSDFDLTSENKDLRDYVLDKKKKIIEASYAAWFHTMKNFIIGGSKKSEEETPNDIMNDENNNDSE
ncbi:MAG: DUF4407 domain-containing protein [Bacteroidales bacterium]|nr:DUF4407 domain-containing protein [Bacteroidales bacterium]